MLKSFQEAIESRDTRVRDMEATHEGERERERKREEREREIAFLING